jgi:predicted short-subunit dehydrogenase-like oxidoreductase (DUF2520 family)
MTGVQTKQSSRTHYLLIGNGRVARHFKHYLQILNLEFSSWNRSLSSEELQNSLRRSTHVLLAISDSALSSFYENHLKTWPGQVVHFSGALELPPMIGAHPLMTFGAALYDDAFYAKIPFVLSTPTSLKDLLPGFNNPYFRIRPEQKAYYHALCVLGGNLTTLLLQKMLQGFESLELPPSMAQLYVEQIVRNVFTNPSAALTGPLARKDFATVQKNLTSLQGDSYADVYRSFLPIVYPEFQEGPK